MGRQVSVALRRRFLTRFIEHELDLIVPDSATRLLLEPADTLPQLVETLDGERFAPIPPKMTANSGEPNRPARRHEHLQGRDRASEP